MCLGHFGCTGSLQAASSGGKLLSPHACCILHPITPGLDHAQGPGSAVPPPGCDRVPNTPAHSPSGCDVFGDRGGPRAVGMLLLLPLTPRSHGALPGLQKSFSTTVANAGSRTEALSVMRRCQTGASELGLLGVNPAPPCALPDLWRGQPPALLQRCPERGQPHVARLPSPHVQGRPPPRADAAPMQAPCPQASSPLSRPGCVGMLALASAHRIFSWHSCSCFHSVVEPEPTIEEWLRGAAAAQGPVLVVGPWGGWQRWGAEDRGMWGPQGAQCSPGCVPARGLALVPLLPVASQRKGGQDLGTPSAEQGDAGLGLGVWGDVGPVPTGVGHAV